MNTRILKHIALLSVLVLLGAGVWYQYQVSSELSYTKALIERARQDISTLKKEKDKLAVNQGTLITAISLARGDLKAAVGEITKLAQANDELRDQLAVLKGEQDKAQAATNTLLSGINKRLQKMEADQSSGTFVRAAATQTGVATSSTGTTGNLTDRVEKLETGLAALEESVETLQNQVASQGAPSVPAEESVVPRVDSKGSKVAFVPSENLKGLIQKSKYLKKVPESKWVFETDVATDGSNIETTYFVIPTKYVTNGVCESCYYHDFGKHLDLSADPACDTLGKQSVFVGLLRAGNDEKGQAFEYVVKHSNPKLVQKNRPHRIPVQVVKTSTCNCE